MRALVHHPRSHGIKRRSHGTVFSSSLLRRSWLSSPLQESELCMFAAAFLFSRVVTVRGAAIWLGTTSEPGAQRRDQPKSRTRLTALFRQGTEHEGRSRTDRVSGVDPNRCHFVPRIAAKNTLASAWHDLVAIRALRQTSALPFDSTQGELAHPSLRMLANQSQRPTLELAQRL